MHVLAPTPTDSRALKVARDLLDGMPPVMWFIRRQMRRHRTAGLSVPQFRALALLDRYPTASLSMVAEHLGSSQPSASRLITGLVARGFVTRKECADDRRQVALLLTNRGSSVLEKARDATQASLAEEIAHLADDDQATISAAMKILHEAFSPNNETAESKN